MRLAAQGARNLNGGNEAIDDEAERQAVRHQARRVMLESVVAAALLALLCLAFPL